MLGVCYSVRHWSRALDALHVTDWLARLSSMLCGIATLL